MAKVRGVNLGGWFVLERWMSQSLFEGVEGKDETAFSTQKESAESHLKHHWDTFITEDDFLWLAQHQVNYVRIPFPWWIFGENPPYFSCLSWLDQAMDWANKHKIKVVLDLHTAPGCQNGFDNGGIEGVCTWHLDVERIERTTQVLERIANRYTHHPALWAIEALNEPRWDIDISIIQKFYLDVYQRLRQILKPEHFVIFHDAFRSNQWETFFKQHTFENVLLDIHLYQCFEERFNQAGMNFNLVYPLQTQLELVQKVSQVIPCIIGEWSLGLHPNNFKNYDAFNKELALRAYAANQLVAFEHSFGWFFWSYKNETDRLSWNFKELVEQNILPHYYGDKSI
jgi:glucan 1,3-beta-glucosidase